MVEASYEVVIEQGGERWRWVLRADGAIAASGPADSAESARCSGAFAAAAVSALIRIRRRDVCRGSAAGAQQPEGAGEAGVRFAARTVV